MLPALEAILGQRSAHSFATGPVMAEPTENNHLPSVQVYFTHGFFYNRLREAFLAWDDFHTCSHFIRSTIHEEKIMGTTRSLFL